MVLIIDNYHLMKFDRTILTTTYVVRWESNVFSYVCHSGHSRSHDDPNDPMEFSLDGAEFSLNFVNSANSGRRVNLNTLSVNCAFLVLW